MKTSVDYVDKFIGNRVRLHCDLLGMSETKLAEARGVIKGVNPIDLRIGARARMRRLRLGMSQEKLANVLGLNLQQVQEYEHGKKRIGASLIQQISQALNTSPSFFFDSAINDESFQPPDVPEPSNDEDIVAEFFSSEEGIQFIRAVASIRDPKIRTKIVHIVTSLAETGA